MTGMTRAGAWIRVSTGGQDEANQVPDIEHYADAHHYQIRKRYVSHSKSASKGEQQAALDEVIRDMLSGMIEVLVCWHSDRLERRTVREALNLLWEVGDAGGRIESVKEGLLDEDNLATIVAAHINHEKSVHVTEQTKLGHDRVDANGAYRYKVPFGYRLEGPKYYRHLVPDDLGREWVPQIFDKIIGGHSLAEVCWWLDSLKIRFYAHDITRKDDDGSTHVIHHEGDPAPWWPATVAQLIRNPVYIGHVATDDGRWVHECEPLVDATTFRKANEALSDRARRQRGPRGLPENRAMLRGAIRCPVCGNRMHKNQSDETRTRDGSKRPYYRCRGTGPAQKGCGLNVRMDLVDGAVNTIMATTFRVPVMLRTLVKGHDWEPELDALAMEFRQLTQRGLSRAEFRAEQDRIWALEDDYRTRPVEDDRWEETPTGELYSDVYAGLPISERGAWLAANGFTVTATKAAATVTRGELTATLPL